jgi:hypothetical protein
MEKIRQMIATYKAKFFINHDKKQSDTLKLLPRILRLRFPSGAKNFVTTSFGTSLPQTPLIQVDALRTNIGRWFGADVGWSATHQDDDRPRNLLRIANWRAFLGATLAI